MDGPTSLSSCVHRKQAGACLSRGCCSLPRCAGAFLAIRGHCPTRAAGLRCGDAVQVQAGPSAARGQQLLPRVHVQGPHLQSMLHSHRSEGAPWPCLARVSGRAHQLYESRVPFIDP